MSIEDSTKKQILESAYQLFVERGFQGSSMRDIADRAGIKAASIYNHFGGKEQIFEEVFKEKHPMFRILSILDTAQGETAEDLLTDAVNRLNKELRSEPKLLNLFFVEFVEMDGKHIPAAIEANFPHDSTFMRRIFRMKSELRNIREPVLVRSLIGTVFANIMFNWFIGDSKPKRWGSQTEMTDVLLRGLLREK
ncbi:MAG: TetR/AcrR family transcriptional regulator [Candidatus Thorarchaeota archaeon]|jgi:AcrR family transcriptional regulator